MAENSLLRRMQAVADLPGKLAIAASALSEMGARLNATTVESIDSGLQSHAPEALLWAKELPPGPNTAYLCALLAGRAGVDEVHHWERFFSFGSVRDPFHRLAYARALVAESRTADATRQIQLALSSPVRYTFFPRAEKLIDKLWAEPGWPLRKARIAILGTSTTSLLVPVLKALCLRDRIEATFYQGLYGAMQQEILEPGSGLAKFRPDIVFLISNWRDLNLPPISNDESSVCTVSVETQANLWRRLAEQFGCHVVQHAFDFPAAESYGYLASRPGGRTRMIESINRQMFAQAPSHVSILDSPAVQRQTGLDRWENATLWNAFKQHPGTDALPALAEMQQAHVRAVLGLTRKVLVTDLDNTLWKGIIGEDGLDGIQTGPETAAGEAHLRLQQYLFDLKTRGILLAVCSKNNPEDARLPFEKHPHMHLRLDDFAAFKANWNDKTQNIREIAEQLSLGLDSFVFVDDNPMEREWVRTQLPQVAVPELGNSPADWVQELDRTMHFFSLSLSPEDLARSEQYRSEAQREILRASSQSLDEFLAGLQMQGSVEPVTQSNLARVAQLCNKTNQFNLTTRRYTEAQVLQLAQRPHCWAGAFRLADRMGDCGLIGVIFCVPASAGGGWNGDWEIETWLMSCRVLGRQMERFMLDRLLEEAVAGGAKNIVGVYRPTPKNGLVAQLYADLGFTKTSESDEETRYSLPVPADLQPSANHVRDVSLRTVPAGAS